MSAAPQMSEALKLAQLAAIVILAAASAWFFIRTYSQTVSRQSILIRLFALTIVIVGVGIGAGSYFASFFPPIFAFIATGLLTFFGFVSLLFRGTPDARVEDRDIRIAIAASITTMYLTIVGYGIWVGKSGETDPIALSLMNSFSAVVGTVIAFYFGTTAYLEGKADRPRINESKDGGA